MGTVEIASTTQRITVNPANSSVAVINAGPQGPIGHGGGAGGLDQTALLAYLRAGALAAGPGIAIDLSDPDTVRFDNNIAYHGETGYLLADLDPVTDTITYTIDPAFKQRMTTLESSRALLQSRDALSAGGTFNYMNFPGTTGNYISTPSNSVYDTAGDASFVARVKMPSAPPAADSTIVSRRGSTAATTQFAVTIKTTGQLQFSVSANGTTISTAATTAATPLSFDGNWIWLRFTRIASTGMCSFFYAADTLSNGTIPTTWTTFQTNKATTVGAMFAGTGVPVEISGYNAGANAMFAGQIGRVLMYPNSASTGTPLFDANASDYTTGTSWTGPTGKVFSFVGSAAVILAGQVVSNTSAEFTLNETDPFPLLPVVLHDTLMWTGDSTLFNTSGSAVNFTPKLRMNGVDLFTFPAISIPSTAAGSIYNMGCGVKVNVNAADGTTQIARAELIISNAVTGTDLGSIVMASNLAMYTGNRAGAISTITTVPQFQLKLIMATAAATIGARGLRSQVFIAKG